MGKQLTKKDIEKMEQEIEYLSLIHIYALKQAFS